MFPISFDRYSYELEFLLLTLSTLAPGWQEILASNPNAKVVLTLRDPDAWWRSFSTTISRKNPALTTWGT